MKKLTRSRTNAIICGVCGGVAEYLDIDPSIVRIIWLIFTLTGGAGFIAYLICAVVIPKGPKGSKKKRGNQDDDE